MILLSKPIQAGDPNRIFLVETFVNITQKIADGITVKLKVTPDGETGGYHAMSAVVDYPTRAQVLTGTIFPTAGTYYWQIWFFNGSTELDRGEVFEIVIQPNA